MSNTITLTIFTDDDLALRRAAIVLNLLADQVGSPMVLPDAAPLQGSVEQEPAAGTVEPESAGSSPPPPPPVEQEQVSTLPPPPLGVEVDSEGLPWDARIHAATKTRLKSNDTWKVKRNMDDVTVAMVKAELRATMAAPKSDEAPTADPAVLAQTPADTSNVPAPPDTTAPAGVGDDLDASSMITFPELMARVTADISAGSLTNEQLNQVLQARGIPNLVALNSRPDLVAPIAGDVDVIMGLV
jgi:hypothetical protein